MKKPLLMAACIAFGVLILMSCGSAGADPKVDKVIQEQIQQSQDKEAPVQKEKPQDSQTQTELSQSQKEALEGLNNFEDEMLSTSESEEGIDVDLTKLSSTMVYSEVYNMMYTPTDYLNKVVKMNGTFAIYKNETNGQIYFTCIVSDATACCSQGIEFTLVDGYKYPDDYPEVGGNLTVTGVFETYEEDGYYYCRLKDATLG